LVAPLMNPQKQGFLLIRGKTLKKWESHWFVLKDKFLYDYKSVEITNPCRIIPLEKCSTMLVDDKQQEFGFKLSVTDKDFYLASENNQEMTSWIEAIMHVRGTSNALLKPIIPINATLRIQVEEGFNIDSIADPFCFLIHGIQQYKTSVVRRDLFPQWHESFTFDVSDKNGEVHLVMWDEKNNFNGQVTINIADVEFGKPLKHWFRLCPRRTKEKIQGTISVELEFTNYDLSVNSVNINTINTFNTSNTTNIANATTSSTTISSTTSIISTSSIAPPNSISNIPSIEEVPLAVKKSVEYLKVKAMDYVGLFRLNSDHYNQIHTLKKAFDRGENVSLDKVDDANIVAGLLKLVLQELPEPLLTYNLYPKFLEAYETTSKHQLRLGYYYKLIGSLATAKHALLQLILKFLNAICQRANLNRMTAANLAIIFGPIFLRAQEESQEAILAIVVVDDIVKTLIEDYDKIFDKKQDKTN